MFEISLGSECGGLLRLQKTSEFESGKEITFLSLMHIFSQFEDELHEDFSCRLREMNQIRLKLLGGGLEICVFRFLLRFYQQVFQKFDLVGLISSPLYPPPPRPIMFLID